MIDDQSKLFALILVGGKSSRMGQAKAHMVMREKPQWQHSRNLLENCCDEIYFSTSPHLLPPLPVDQAHLINDIFSEPIGPLGGIISALKKFPHQAFFVLACDLPNFSDEAVRILSCARDPEKKATVYFHDDNVEPLCAIYEPAIFLDLLTAYAENIYCPRKILSRLDIKKVIPKDPSWLTNVNHAHEVVRFQQDKSVVIHYYAALKEQRKLAKETLFTSTKTVYELFLECKRKYNFTLNVESLRYAKNDRLVSSEEIFNDGDEIVFIPPVSGG